MAASKAAPFTRSYPRIRADLCFASLASFEAAAAGCRLLVADASGLGELARDGFARAIPLDEAADEVGRAVVEELAKPPPQKRPDLTSWDECAGALLDLYRSLA